MPRRNPRPAFSAPHSEPTLARAERRALGAYYTPPEIVELILKLALEPAMSHSCQPPAVIDPACGAGEFLAAAAAHLTRRFGSAASVHGIDCDGEAVAA